MTRIGVAGAGAFGTALAVALAQAGREVTLWARDPAHVSAMAASRENARRLPGVLLPDGVTPTAAAEDLRGCAAILVAVPMQETGGFLRAHGAALKGSALIACSKGVDLTTQRGPVGALRDALPDSRTLAMLTGPGFAVDIARGLPTALTLACADEAAGQRLQELLATPALRLYRSTDVTGAELGGALKNVIAIAAGIVIGAGLGDSARAALMTRGYAEMLRLALALGARAETLAGLSGFGDLVLTCTSDKSRNFRFGRALGADARIEPGETVEGVATARASLLLAARHGVDLPVTETVAAITEGRLTVADAAGALLARPLKEE